MKQDQELGLHNVKQTALQWFLDKLPHSIETQFSKQIQQALQMEREQMKEVYVKGIKNYDPTFGGNNE
jgi:hypothetical protein